MNPTCPVTITSPAPSPGFIAATGLGANVVCGMEVRPIQPMPPGAVGHFRCPMGHEFFAVVEDDSE